MPTLNRPLIEKIIHKLETEPQLHDQRTVGEMRDCGTAHCVAGWALAMTPGYEMDWSLHGGYIRYITDPAGKKVPFDDAASEVMGLTLKVADSLFFDMGDTDHMIGRLKDLLNEGGK